METSDRYLSFVQWSKADRAYVGYCPDLFPGGGVCHGATAVEAFKRLCEIVEDTVATAEAKGLRLPPPRTRPMRDVEMAV
jgi:predicted RNase H-like HicB family nuclease